MNSELHRRLGEARLEELRREVRVDRFAAQLREERRDAARGSKADAPRWRRAFGGVLVAAGTRLVGE